MKKTRFFYMKNEAGMSLVELLASIVILSILMFIFLGMFIQSSKVNVKSEEVIDVTYEAQQRMEELYGLSKKKAFTEREGSIAGLGYTLDVSGAKFDTYKADTADYDVEVQLQNNIIVDPDDPDFDGTTRVIIEVKSKSPVVGEDANAQMELLLRWEGVETP